MIENMQEFIDEWGLEDDVIILKPQSDFNGGIIGVSEDRCHLIYSYDKLVESLAESYKNYDLKNSAELKIDDEYRQDAIDWIEVNTIPSIKYWNQDFAPIIMYEV